MRAAQILSGLQISAGVSVEGTLPFEAFGDNFTGFSADERV
jgi:hypothetical protein